MIGDMCRDIQDSLHARGWPVDVDFGPEYFRQDNFRERILVYRNPGGDSVLPVSGWGRNPRKRMARVLGCVAEVWVQSTEDGATYEEHESRLDDVVDAFLTALQDWGKETGASPDMAAHISESGVVPREDLNEAQVTPGAKYLLRFGVPRGVELRDSDGTGLNTASTPNFTNRTDVYRQAAPEGATAEVGCEDV